MNKRTFMVITPGLFGNSREQQIFALLLEGGCLEITSRGILIWEDDNFISISLGLQSPIGKISPQRNGKVLANFFKSSQEATYSGDVIIDFPYYQMMMVALIVGSGRQVEHVN